MPEPITKAHHGSTPSRLRRRSSPRSPEPCSPAICRSPGGPKPDPLTLPLTTIYLPTRRAARALREAFLAEAKGDALLLPRIRALGDPDEEAAIIFGAEDGRESTASPGRRPSARCSGASR